MNENQGAKGGKQDRKRVFKIKQFYIEQIKELNKNEKFKKKLKKKKLLQLQILIPILLKIFLSKEKTPKKKIVSIKKETKKKSKETTTRNDIKKKEKKETEKVKVNKQEKLKKSKNKDILEDIVLTTLPVPVALLNEKKDIKVSSKKIINNIQNKTKQEKLKKDIPNTEKESIEIITAKEENKPEELEILEILDLEEPKKEIRNNDELEKYKANKIVSLYEDKFKEIRLDLKRLFYEYSLIEEKYDHVKQKREADDILNRLDVLIDKVKELKQKLDIPNSDKYDNSYIYQLVEEYVNEFNNNKAVSSIKSSDLYIDISNKIKELEQEKDYLKKKTIQKKQQLDIDEEKMKTLKEEQEQKEKYNKKINEFTKKADEDLENINKKVNDLVHKNTEITIKLSRANNISNNLLLLIGAEMMIPTANSAKKVAVAATVGIYVLDKLFRKDKYKKNIKEEISTVDYSKEIEASLTSISKTILKLDENIYDIGRMIYLIENDYQDYKDTNDFKNLLNNLYRIKNSLEEKKDNLIKIQNEEEKNLNKNNSKVKVLEENM